MRLVAGIALGVGMGFALAYGLLRPAAGPARAASPAAPVVPAPAEPEAPVAPQDSTGNGPSGAVVVRTPGGVNMVILGRSLPEIRRALADARAAADWTSYFAALNELGAMRMPEAEALLVEVMGDATLRFEGPWTGKSFLQWLAESETPGLLEAARRRAEIDVAENPDSRWRGVGWLSLIALRGGAAEIAWIESLGGGDRNREMEVDSALAEGARNPLAAARLAARMKEPGHVLASPYIEAFARENPRAALEAAVEALPMTPDRRTGELLRLIAEATTKETLDRARAALLAQKDPTGLEALRTVERMRQRGLDVSGFAPIVDEPRLVLERSASRPLDRGEAEVVRGALRAIGENPVTWSEATLAAVRAFTGNPDAGIADAARGAAAMIERKGALKSDGWDPERRSG